MAGPTLAEVETETAADTMRAVLAEQGGKLDEGKIDEPVVAEKPAKVTATDDDGGAAERAASEERARDARGRFARVEAQADVGSDAVEPADAGTKPQVAATDDELEPPTDWTLEDQQEFRALPNAKVKAMVLNRANAAREAQQQADQIRTYYQGIDNILAPRRDVFARDGLDDAGAVRQIFSLSDFAARQPTDFTRWFMQARGITPQQLFPEYFQPQGQTEEESLIAGDPVFQQQQQELNDLRGVISQWQQQQQRQAQQYAQQEHTGLVNEIQTFKGEKDDKGRLKHPYLEDVRQDMSLFVGSGRAPDLQTAYDMACRAHPEVYAKINAARDAEAQRELARKQREKAASARQAGSSITGTPGDRAAPAQSDDIREDMRRSAAEMGLIS